MDDKYHKLVSRCKVEQSEDWQVWIKKIPFIKFPADREVKIIPPFGGALIRFLVKKNESENISVYLDVYGRLGAVENPYWEVYPYHDDVVRVDMENVEELLQRIQEALAQ